MSQPTWHKAHRDAMLAEGICPQCSRNEVIPGYTLCDYCLSRRTEYQLQKANDNQSKGLCRRHGRPVREGSKCCDTCREDWTKAAKKRYALSLVINKGDYVLATKWHDGDPQDYWAVGFFDRMLGEDRFIVVDEYGGPFRANGFRRVKKISKARGAWLLAHAKEIEFSGRSVWGWLRRPMHLEAE